MNTLAELLRLNRAPLEIMQIMVNEDQKQKQLLVPKILGVFGKLSSNKLRYPTQITKIGYDS